VPAHRFAGGRSVTPRQGDDDLAVFGKRSPHPCGIGAWYGLALGLGQKPCTVSYLWRKVGQPELPTDVSIIASLPQS
jgi:hypothetical protein